MVCATEVVTSLIPKPIAHTFLQSYAMRSQCRKATNIEHFLDISLEWKENDELGRGHLMFDA